MNAEMTFAPTARRNAAVTDIITSRGYRRGLEVGVREGDLSLHVLTTTEIHWTGIDVERLPSAAALEGRFPGRYELLTARSPQAASLFPDGAFDFVHIDAGHSYADVKADLEAWWPKLSAGGCLSGDDYADTDNPGEGPYGVVRAVNEFADSRGLELFVEGAGRERPDQLAWAAFNGFQAGKYLRGLPHEAFDNPVWYAFKPAGGER